MSELVCLPGMQWLSPYGACRAVVAVEVGTSRIPLLCNDTAGSGSGWWGVDADRDDDAFCRGLGTHERISDLPVTLGHGIRLEPTVVC